MKELQDLHLQIAALKNSVPVRGASERAIREGRLAESIMDTVREPFLLLDRHLKIMAANRAFHTVFQITPDKTMGKSIYDLENGQWNIPRLRVLLEEILPARLMVNDFKISHEFRGAGLKTLVLNARHVYRKDIGASMTLLAVEDITACSRLEHALKESGRRAAASLCETENMLCAITDAAMEALFLVDDEGRIRYWNSAATRIFGYAIDEIIGREVTLLIPPESRELYERTFRDFVESGRGAMPSGTYEASALRKDGTEIPVELSLAGVLLQGRWHSVGIARDITDRKRLEGQRCHAQKMEGIGQLARGIAHNFNNLFTAIIGYSHLIRVKMQEDDPSRAHVEHILECSERAAYLTHGLLAFSGKQAINPQPININEIVKRVEKFLINIIGEDIVLKTLFRSSSAVVNADAGQIEQVLASLTDNARDAMPQGGSFSIETDTMVMDDLFIRSHGYGEPGTYAVVTVTDSGMGMDEATRKKIFEPYFTTKEPGKGTGLGLSIAYGIIKQHKGYIDVSSEPGQGSAFRIYLPLIREEQKDTGDPATMEVRELSRGTATILMAEDNDDVRELMHAILEGFGYRVVPAEKGEAGIRKFTEHQDDARMVIPDMIMPGKNGRAALDEISRVRLT